MSLPNGIVTFLFTDIEGSTKLWEEQTSSMEKNLKIHDEILSGIIQECDGYVFKTVGDAFCAAFSSPDLAVSAAANIQEALSHTEWVPPIKQLRVRIGLHSGAAELQSADYFGPTVNRVARVSSTAHGGQTVLSASTYELVRDRLPADYLCIDLGMHKLKDLFREEHIYQLTSKFSRESFPPLKSLTISNNNLPVQLTPFLGRRKDIEILTDMIKKQGIRLITLTGPGGTGKTRLSLQVASHVAASFHNGVWFVDLSSVITPNEVIRQIEDALNIPSKADTEPLEHLIAVLCQRKAFIILDNFEQIMSSAYIVGKILGACPDISVMVTSRELLHLYGEQDFPVLPLSYPKEYRNITEPDLPQFDAATLFIQSAKTANPQFTVNDENAPFIAEICSGLSGLPLAIEIAASRCRMFSPKQLLKHLDNKLNILTGGSRNLPLRQQTIRGAIEWSYNLLDETEKTVFYRLAVFRGGSTLESVEHVCLEGLETTAIDIIQSLLDKNLLFEKAGFDGGPRFYMYETILEFSHEKLKNSGEKKNTEQLYIEYFRDVFSTDLFRLYMTPEQDEAREHLRLEYTNVYNIILLCMDNENYKSAIGIFVNLSMYIIDLGAISDMVFLVEKLIEHLPDVDAELKGRFLISMALYYEHNGRDIEKALNSILEAAEILKDLNKPKLEVLALNFSAFYSACQDPRPSNKKPIEYIERSLSLFADQPESFFIIEILQMKALVLFIQDDLEGGNQLNKEIFDRAIKANYTSLLFVICYNLAEGICMLGDDIDTAKPYLITAFELKRNRIPISGRIGMIGVCAGFLSLKGDVETAARLYGAMDEADDFNGNILPEITLMDFVVPRTQLSRVMGKEMYDELCREGRSLNLEEAETLARVTLTGFS